MKVGDYVTNDYHGIHRYGKIKEVKHNFKGDNWSYFDIEWVDDEIYQKAISHRKSLIDGDHGLELYRSDQIQSIDIDRTIKALVELQNK